MYIIKFQVFSILKVLSNEKKVGLCLVSIDIGLAYIFAMFFALLIGPLLFKQQKTGFSVCLSAVRYWYRRGLHDYIKDKPELFFYAAILEC